MIKNSVLDNSFSQGIASYVDYLNDLRLSDLLAKLDIILKTETSKLKDIDDRTFKALGNIDLAQSEIENIISSNRGGNTGVHGFIAEYAEAGILNAKRSFAGLRKVASVLNDNGHADLHIGKHDVQMKFYNNLANELKQASTYRDMNMMYSKDHVEIFTRIMNGETNIDFEGSRLSAAKIENIKKLIEEESNLRGVPFHKWIESSNLRYDEVQSNTIHGTLEQEKQYFRAQTDSEKSQVKIASNEKRVEAQQQAQPTLAEASKVAGIGAAVQGSLKFGIHVWKKHKEGKEIWEFDKYDWKECGLETAKGAVKGGITGYSIYGLTNICHLSAPSAGAITSGTFGLANAVIKYRTGTVDEDEFIDLVMFNSIDATGAAVGAAIGQAIIPIPVVGAVIGSIITTTALGLGKSFFNKQEEEIINRYNNKLQDYIKNLDDKYTKIFNELMEKYCQLGELQAYSFNVELNINLRVASSISFAQEVGVPEGEILHNIQEVDAFFLG